MRLFGVFMIAFIPLLYGLDMYSALKKREKNINDFLKFIKFTKEEIRFSSREIDEIVSLAIHKFGYKGEILHQFEIYNHNRGYYKLSENLKKLTRTGFKDSDLNAISEFYTGLGINDVKGQISHCDYYISIFENRLKEAENSKKVKGKLCISLSVSLALALFIVMV